MKVICIENDIGITIGKCYDVKREFFDEEGDLIYVLDIEDYGFKNHFNTSYYSYHFKKLEDIREEKLNNILK